MTRDWIVYGIRSPYVYDAAASIRRSGGRVLAFVGNLPGPDGPTDLDPLVTPDAVDRSLLGCPVIVPMMTPGHRKTAAEDAASVGFSDFAPLLDASAILADDVGIDIGCQVNAGSVVAAQTRLGRFVMINRSASIGHHSILEDYVSIGPAAVLCGECTIGRGAFVGAGAVLGPKVRIGANATIAAGAVVMKDVPDFGIAAGNPAVVRAIRRTGYNRQTV